MALGCGAGSLKRSRADLRWGARQARKLATAELSGAEGGEGDRVSEGLLGQPEPRSSIFGFRQGINGGQEDYPLIGWRPLTVECLP